MSFAQDEHNDNIGNLRVIVNDDANIPAGKYRIICGEKLIKGDIIHLVRYVNYDFDTPEEAAEFVRFRLEHLGEISEDNMLYDDAGPTDENIVTTDIHIYYT